MNYREYTTEELLIILRDKAPLLFKPIDVFVNSLRLKLSKNDISQRIDVLRYSMGDIVQKEIPDASYKSIDLAVNFLLKAFKCAWMDVLGEKSETVSKTE